MEAEGSMRVYDSMSFLSFLKGETDVSNYHKPPFHKSSALAVTLGQRLPKAELTNKQINCFAGRFRKESGAGSQRLNAFPHTAARLPPAQKAGDSMGKSCPDTAFSAGNQGLQDCQFNWRKALESLLLCQRHGLKYKPCFICQSTQSGCFR